MSRCFLGLLYILPVNFIPSFSVKKKAEINKQSPLFVRITKFTIISSEGSLKSKVDLLSLSSSREWVNFTAHYPTPFSLSPQLSLIRSEKEQHELVMTVKGLKSWALLSCPFITHPRPDSHPALTLIWITCPAPLPLSVLIYNRHSLIRLHLRYSVVAGSITDCDEPFNRPRICLVGVIVVLNGPIKECEIYRNRYKWSP